MTTPAPSLDLAMLSIHEAGHAAATLALGYSLDRVGIEPAETLARFGPGAWRHELTVLMAGDAAARRAGAPDRATSDADDARKLITQVSANAWELALAKGRAEALVDAEWTAIERIAAALLSRRLLFGADVRRLMVGGDVADGQLTLLRLALAGRAA